MAKFSKNINEFTSTCDSELNTLVGNISMLQKNMNAIRN